MSRHRRLILGLVFAIAALPAVAAGDEPKPDAANSPPERPGILHRLIYYVPNRLLDTVDIVRLRARVGPGLAAGVRATAVADVYLGSYVSVYAGVPGPRMRKLPKLPVGLESYNGVRISLADATVSGGIGPDYSPFEFGVSVHPALVGLDAGFDPVEILDFMTGLVLIDLRGDDL